MQRISVTADAAPLMRCIDQITRGLEFALVEAVDCPTEIVDGLVDAIESASRAADVDYSRGAAGADDLVVTLKPSHRLVVLAAALARHRDGDVIQESIRHI